MLGDRWSLLIIRDVMFFNLREFGLLQRSGEGIATNVLADRLTRLESKGILRKDPHPTHGRKFVYSLTESGIALAPMLVELALWSRQYMDNATIPGPIYEMMVHDREGMLRKIRNGEPLLDLSGQRNDATSGNNRPAPL